VLFVAVMRERIVGAELVHADALERLFVIPEYWGRGIADVLHNAAVETWQSAGTRVVRLEVLEENRRARRFYERHGWNRDARRRLGEVPPYPDVISYSLAIR
jgi:GNAT superfamily N-acetyltransferase